MENSLSIVNITIGTLALVIIADAIYLLGYFKMRRDGHDAFTSEDVIEASFDIICHYGKKAVKLIGVAAIIAFLIWLCKFPTMRFVFGYLATILLVFYLFNAGNIDYAIKYRERLYWEWDWWKSWSRDAIVWHYTIFLFVPWILVAVVGSVLIVLELLGNLILFILSYVL